MRLFEITNIGIFLLKEYVSIISTNLQTAYI